MVRDRQIISGQRDIAVFRIDIDDHIADRVVGLQELGDDVDAAEVLEAFLGQFYDGKEPPRLLILSNEIENIKKQLSDLDASVRFTESQPSSRPSSRRHAVLAPVGRRGLVHGAQRRREAVRGRHVPEARRAGRLGRGAPAD